jgi:hypothetical protein
MTLQVMTWQNRTASQSQARTKLSNERNVIVKQASKQRHHAALRLSGKKSGKKSDQMPGKMPARHTEVLNNLHFESIGGTGTETESKGWRR